MSSRVVAAPERPLGARRPGLPGWATTSAASDGATCLAVALLLAAATLGAGGGLQLGPLTRVEIGVDLVGGLAGALAILMTRGRVHGGLSLALFAVLAALTGVSILWSVQPDDSWIETSRTLSYVALFGLGIVFVRAAPARWPALLGAVIACCAFLSLYALATKCFPASLAPDETYARLREPFGYWNAVGLVAALGVPGCLWLGARRHGHAALNALAYPVLGILLVAMLLAYSRGSLLAVVVGSAVWFALVPLRLRGVAVLATASGGALLIAAWAFGRDGLSSDQATLDLRTAAGHQLAVALAAMVVVLAAAGLAIGFATGRRAPRQATRRRAGVVVLVALALVPVGLAVGLSLSERGLGGSISKGFRDLTDPDSQTKLGNDAGRLTAVGSVRARYYDESLRIFRDRPLVGAGAGGYATARPRYRTDQLDVRHSHGYLFQTAADLGALGLAASLALTAAWLVAAARAVRLHRRGWRREPFDPERVGLLTLIAIVVVFAVHSLVDWTWFVPGCVAIAALCAGWVAGRGPGRPASVQPLRAGLRSPVRAVGAAGAVVVALAGAWATAQPLRAVHADDDALALVGRPGQARAAQAKALEAVEVDPLSIEPLRTLAAVRSAGGDDAGAQAALRRAVRLQPQNAAAWQALAEFELLTRQDPRAALQALGPALYLDPRNVALVQDYLQASTQAGAAG